MCHYSGFQKVTFFLGFPSQCHMTRHRKPGPLLTGADILRNQQTPVLSEKAFGKGQPREKVWRSSVCLVLGFKPVGRCGFSDSFPTGSTPDPRSICQNSVNVKKKLLMGSTLLKTIKLFNTHHPVSLYVFFLNSVGEGQGSNTRALHPHLLLSNSQVNVLFPTLCASRIHDLYEEPASKVP